MITAAVIVSSKGTESYKGYTKPASRKNIAGNIGEVVFKMSPYDAARGYLIGPRDRFVIALFGE